MTSKEDFSNEKALDFCLRFILDNNESLGNNFKSKEEVLNFVLTAVKKDVAKILENPTAVYFNIEDVLTAIKNDFNRYGYNRRFDKTATKKKVTTVLKATQKDKKLHAYQIFLAFRLYLRECRSKKTEPQFVKLASSFMTNMVYDYAEMINGEFEQLMENTYGENWRKVKFVYV